MIKVKINDILEEKKISVYALSKNIGISQHNLSKLIKGETNSIRFDTLEKIADELQCDICDILKIVKD
ncbi:helix-turn-helix domain-containing protein [Clostridium sp. FP1]|uniref:helix-turn-helix domain-containing protein n=1 Tax=Clostridium sp. FP1 TaxID=2724076 RepID=UPI0013E91B5B|nr:helix-turn-helix transcriptional regulator [Clostridium sp. FP1]MBZ9635532.1 helix-turn-helix transcriptional regulator [Clostridium sp. FP1]